MMRKKVLISVVLANCFFISVTALGEVENVKSGVKKKVGSNNSENAGSTSEDKEKEQHVLDQDNALARARMEQERVRLEEELFQIHAEIEKLKAMREIENLKGCLELEKFQRDHEKEMMELNRKRDKLKTEVEISQAEMAKSMEQFNMASLELQKKVQMKNIEIADINSEIARLQAKKNKDQYVTTDLQYSKDPLQKDGTLVVSDRCIDLNGAITEWKANYVIDSISYFNNKSVEYPIFIVIGVCPGGSTWAGQRILEAIWKSKAPVHVVVTGYAASMAAVIATLAPVSYVYSNAIILHHQPWKFFCGNVRELKENYEFMHELWLRFGGRIAKKMGITLQEFDKQLYENAAGGDWRVYGDVAKKIKWIDHTIGAIKDCRVLKMPESANYTCELYLKEYYGRSDNECLVEDGKNIADFNSPIHSSLLNHGGFCYMYNPNAKSSAVSK